MTEDAHESARRLPAMNRILDNPVVAPLCDLHGRDRVKTVTRAILEQYRENETGTKLPRQSAGLIQTIAAQVAEAVERDSRHRLRRVINATGVVLHTNLGRAPLAAAAREAIAEAAGYADLELDLKTGRRGSRTARLEDLWRDLTGAESCFIVNNCAAATLLTLSALARGREVIISRGQLIEIGGSYRLPEVFAAAGATLREVGTTNRTHLRDYKQAIGESTAALLRVHQSNFRQLGFTESCSLPDLVELSRRHSLPLIDDIGSGCLVDLSEFGLRGEPTIGRSLDQGADVVLFSGDKLLGGPQSGVILGRKDIVDQLRRSPLARALRVDKLTLAALEATLRIYLANRAFEELPVLHSIAQPLETLWQRARRIQHEVHSQAPHIGLDAEPVESTIGGGAFPADTLCSVGLVWSTAACDDVAAALRAREPAVLTRIHRGTIVFDLRTIAPEDDRSVVEAMLDVAGRGGHE